jgi:hypothetical protein
VKYELGSLLVRVSKCKCVINNGELLFLSIKVFAEDLIIVVVFKEGIIIFKVALMLKKDANCYSFINIINNLTCISRLLTTM